ncbi:ABC transporter permease [Halanaerocella petrolearia]
MVEDLIYKNYNQKISATSLTESKQRIDKTKILISIIALFNIAFILLVITSLFLKSSVSDILLVVQNITTLNAVRVTITSLVSSATVTMVIGVPLAYVMVHNNRIGRVINIILNIPLVMPPTVAGLALLMTFGRRGALESIVTKLNFDIPFSFIALVIVQIFVMLPLFTQSLKSGFAAIKQDIREAAIVSGAGEKELLVHIYLPLSIRSFLTGIIMACLRAAGEFGATIMFAGNLSGKTQTLSTAIYTLSQRSLDQSISLAVLLIVIFLIPLLIIELKLKK